MKTYQVSFTREIAVNDNIDEQEAKELFLMSIENEPQQDLASYFADSLDIRLVHASSPLK